MRTPLIIFHAGCADGAGAAFAAWCKFGENAEYRPAAYGDAPPTDEEVQGRDVYILDFSYPVEVLNALAYYDSYNVVVIDHHKSFFESFMSYEGRLHPDLTVKLDMKKSGAVLAWEHFHGFDEAVPPLLLYIQDRDLWQWKLGSSREVNIALENRGIKHDFRELKHVVDFRVIRDLEIEGMSLLKMQERQVRSMVHNAEIVELRFLRSMWDAMGVLEPPSPPLGKFYEWLRWSEDGTRGALKLLATNAPILQSEVGNALASKAAELGGVFELGKSRCMPAMAAAWHREGDKGNYKVSLRSIGDVDVSVIAKSFPGGGGHKNAAGFSCAELPWNVVGPLPREGETND